MIATRSVGMLQYRGVVSRYFGMVKKNNMHLMSDWSIYWVLCEVHCVTNLY